MGPPLALRGHASVRCKWPLLGVKRTWHLRCKCLLMTQSGHALHLRLTIFLCSPFGPYVDKAEAMNNYMPIHVHLVGSIGLDTVEEVFSTVGPLLGRRLRRIPDGEPGPRRLWVSFQYPLLRSSPFLRPDPSGALRKTSGFPLLCLAEGGAADDVSFGELGYAREARGSFLDFSAARTRGDIPPETRFQVCLPTPISVIYAFCTARDVSTIEKAYEKAMAREVEAICRHIPHEDLCIQWDVCHDMILWDGQPQDQFPLFDASQEEITDRFA